MTDEPTPFALSRIYAKGWTAGRSFSMDLADEDLAAMLKETNPYATAVERERWQTGFRDALTRNQNPKSGTVR